MAVCHGGFPACLPAMADCLLGIAAFLPAVTACLPAWRHVFLPARRNVWLVGCQSSMASFLPAMAARLPAMTTRLPAMSASVTAMGAYLPGIMPIRLQADCSVDCLPGSVNV